MSNKNQSKGYGGFGQFVNVAIVGGSLGAVLIGYFHAVASFSGYA